MSTYYLMGQERTKKPRMKDGKMISMTRDYFMIVMGRVTQRDNLS